MFALRRSLGFATLLLSPCGHENMYTIPSSQLLRENRMNIGVRLLAVKSNNGHHVVHDLSTSSKYFELLLSYHCTLGNPARHCRYD